MPDEEHNGRLNGALNSFWALVFARFIIPALVVLVGVIGTYFLNSLTHSNESIWTKLSELQAAVDQVHETLSVISTRQLSQSESDRQQLDDHEARLRSLESRRR